MRKVLALFFVLMLSLLACTGIAEEWIEEASVDVESGFLEPEEQLPVENAPSDIASDVVSDPPLVEELSEIPETEEVPVLPDVAEVFDVSESDMLDDVIEESPVDSVDIVRVDLSSDLLHLGGIPDAFVSRSRASAFDEVKQVIYNALISMDDTLDLSMYYLDPDTATQLYWYVVNDNPELFYVSGFVSYGYSSYFEVTQMYPEYRYNRSTVSSMLSTYSNELRKIASTASAGSNVVERALLINDYFCTHFQYDFSYRSTDAYSLFTQKTGTCNAYTQGYTAVMRYLGIATKVATSRAMDHTWNLLRIDGDWYHVDVTWNDIAPDIAGRAGHGYFLCSDARFQNNPGNASHYSWNAQDGIRCASTRFDNEYWRGIDTPIQINHSTPTPAPTIAPTPTPRPVTEYPGLTKGSDGVYRYYQNGVLQVAAEGLTLVGNDFYVLHRGELVPMTNLVLYDNEWFYVTDGRFDTNAYGIYDYDGGKFLLSAGRIVTEYSGLFLNDRPQFRNPDGKWYFISGGQIATYYTGLTFYDGAWFYLINGILAESYTGPVFYDGAYFNVVNGMVIF